MMTMTVMDSINPTDQENQQFFKKHVKNQYTVAIMEIVQGGKISQFMWIDWYPQIFSSEIVIMPLCNRVWPHKTTM